MYSVPGMGDSCDFQGMTRIVSTLEQELGAFVACLKAGDSFAGGVLSSYFGSANRQIDRACDWISSIPELQGGYIGLGFSQGGQLLRGLAQRCNHLGPKMRVLISVGGQHNGIMNIPRCTATDPGWICQVLESMLGDVAYLESVQSQSIQASYFKDPLRMEEYYAHSSFLADINAESKHGNVSMYTHYKNNLESMDALVLFQFEDDDMVVPKESSHFGFYDGNRMISINETPQYDDLGLRKLDETGRLHLLTAPGCHMCFSMEWFQEYVVQKFIDSRGSSTRSL